MTGDRGMRLIAALVAGLLVAFLAGLLLVSGARPAAKAPAREAPPAAPLPVPLPPALDPESSAPAPEEADPSSLPSPDDTVITGTAVLEDGSPFTGVQFLEMAPAEGGGWEVNLDADAPVDRDPELGAFHMRWKERRAEIVLLVLGVTAECVAAEGAAIVGLEERGEVVRFADGIPARLVFRLLPGGPVRLHLEAREGTAAFRWSPPSVELFDGDGALLPRQGVSLDMEEGATSDGIAVMTVVLEVPVLTRSERVEGEGRVAVLKMPFFEPVRLPVAELTEGMRVPLVPLRPAVTGVLSPPAAPRTPSGISIAPAGSAGRHVALEEGVARRLESDGTIRIYNLPDGEWALHVMRGTTEGLRWGRRVFRKGPDPVDLGIVEADGYAGLRMRVLDADGSPVPTASLTVTRAVEVEIGGTDFHAMERPGPRGGLLLLRGDSLAIQPGTEERDPEGWYEIPDLAPSTRYFVQDMAPGWPRAEITTPAENGAWVELELRRKPAQEGK